MKRLRFGFSCLLVGAIFALGRPVAVRAESHIPSFDITPIVIYGTSENITQTPGVPLVDGNVNLNFSAHVPIVRHVVLSYDHFTNGLIFGTIPRIASGGSFVRNVLDFRDFVDAFRLDAAIGKGFNVEVGSAYRHRVCCPADSDPGNPSPNFYHDNYLGFTYATPPFAALHGTQLIYNITGHSSPHNSDTAAAVAAAAAAGYADPKRTEFGITQAATLAVPIDARHGFSAAGTFTWGAFNYFSNTPIPIYYDITILSVNKSVNKYLSLTASVDNFVQRPQGYPFERTSGLNGSSLNLSANVHLGP
ncbi:MAG: hypothetical protein NVS4B5_00460 [Vulcanimicrobiaceae bacterium]